MYFYDIYLMSYRRRKAIPKAIREQIWLREFGKTFESKCKTPWCENKINVWDFHAGHNIPDSKGGKLTAENLMPICDRCNLSMNNKYTFQEWCALGKHSAQKRGEVPLAHRPRHWWCCF
jgi:5-methylcytosine-specific restriction endonuclease McrA